MECAALAAQPGARKRDIAVVQFVYERVKGAAMIHMAQMRDLMRNGRPANMIRRHHEPPTEA